MIRDFVFLSKSNPGGKNILPQRRNSQENDQGMLCFSLKSNPGGKNILPQRRNSQENDPVFCVYR